MDIKIRIRPTDQFRLNQQVIIDQRLRNNTEKPTYLNRLLHTFEHSLLNLHYPLIQLKYIMKSSWTSELTMNVQQQDIYAVILAIVHHFV
jgi:hypothetical protein